MEITAQKLHDAVDLLGRALPVLGRKGIARAFARDCAAGEKRSDALTEEMFSQYLYSNGLPDPELLIRTGGEERISNYLLWQAAYSEFLFTETLWPDFRKAEFRAALESYAKRDRRYGKVK